MNLAQGEKVIINSVFNNIIKFVLMIVTMVVLVTFFLSNVYADEINKEPGDNIENNALWQVSQSDYLGNTNKFWAGWVPIRFGINIDARLKPGDTTNSNIIYADKSGGKLEGDDAVVGYGLYQFLLDKHMVGYLYYIRNLVTKDKTIINSQGKTEKVDLTTPIKKSNGADYTTYDACKYVADELLSTAYSTQSINDLHTLLRSIVEQNSANDIKNWQSEFWYKVFGNKAYNLLSGTLCAESIIGNNTEKTRGCILSIISDIYRNKSLAGKTNLELQIEKGDLLPFLVYTSTYDKGLTIKWEYQISDSKEVVKTTWKQMIKGAYYYMIYYIYKYDYEDGDIEDPVIIYNSTKAEMFRNEYEELMNEPLEELKGKDLDLFYQKVREIRRYYKKADNGGVFGEEEEYSINSDYTYSLAIEKIEEAMKKKPFDEVFKTLDTENIARTYLMAKNIANNTRLIEQNAQYNIGTNILNRTPGGYDNTVLLTDLQRIKLNRDSNGKFVYDSDNDGILDGTEMGTLKDVDITDFVEHLLKAESGLNDVTTLLDNYKKNIIKANKDISKQNLVLSQKDIDVVDDRIVVSLMSYKSNPIFKDTDFDGVWDGYGYDSDGNFINQNVYKDTMPLDSSIKGDMVSSNNHFNKTIYFNSHMDYRYFFLDRFNYYDELSSMSLLLSNAMNKKGSDLSDIDTLMLKIGYDNYVRRNPYGDVDGAYGKGTTKYNIEYITGIKEIEYSKDNTAGNYLKKLIVPIIIKSPDSMLYSNSYSEIGEPNWVEKCDTGVEPHNVKSYEVYAELIKDDLTRVFNESGIDYNSKSIVFWIMGHKEAGAIANVLASKYIDENHEVYGYTFGSPMTLYNNPDEILPNRNGTRARYDSIFNVVNEEDIYSFLLPQKVGFTRYGMTCYASGRDILSGNIVYGTYLAIPRYTEIIYNEILNILIDYKEQTRTYLYSDKKFLSNFFQELYSAVLNYRLNLSDESLKFMRDKYKTDKKLFRLVNMILESYPSIHSAGTSDVYYYVAKNIRNEDIVNTVSYIYDKSDKKIQGETQGIGQKEMCEALEVMGQQYVKNVKTYGSDTYSLSTVSKDVDTAYIRNQYNIMQDLSLKEQREAIKDKFDNLINNNSWDFRCGDDCTRFMFSVMYYTLKGDLGNELSKHYLNEKDKDGKLKDNPKYYTNVDTTKIMDERYDNLFTDLGFKIFYIGKKYKNGIENENGKEFGYEDLEDGDILVGYRDTNVGKGHVEFYIGTKYEEHNPYGWGFGWGSAKNDYPSNSVFGKTIKVDSDKSDEKKYYLLDNFTNYTYDKNKDGVVPDCDYELRYFKVLRMKGD